MFNVKYYNIPIFVFYIRFVLYNFVCVINNGDFLVGDFVIKYK